MKLIKVRALEAYEKNKVRDEALGKIPKAGETFEVDEKRLKKLLGENAYKTTFVEIVEEETKAAKGKGKGKEDAAKEETKAADNDGANAGEDDSANAGEDDSANANGDNEGDK